jgi:MSHA biogenesis protein MshM
MTMYLEHFGLAEAPFKITPHTEFFFAGAARGETLDGLIYAITSGEGMVKVTGEVGAGKTMLCRVLMERLPSTVETIYLAVPSLSRDEMLAVIAQDLGIETAGIGTTHLVRALQEKLVAIHADGRQVVALIDEAHAMPLATLEEIRLLSNLETSHDKLMQIVLFGQPELDAHLSLPHMRQLKERITHSFVLQPLPPRDVKDYIDFRLRAAGYKGPDLFGPDALRLITEASEGLTRRINIYADKTLLAAYAAGTHTIAPDHVRAAVADTSIVLPTESSRQARGTRRMLALAATLLVGLAMGFIAGRLSVGTPTATIAATPAAASTAAASPAVATITPREAAPSPTPVTSVSAPPVPTTAAAPVNASAGSALVPAAVAATATEVNASPTPTTSASRASAEDGLGPRMARDRERLATHAADALVVQLMTADPRESSAIEAFVRIADRELGADRVWVAPAGFGNAARISVIHGPFATREAALRALTRLPATVKRFTPYLRSVQAIRDDAKAPPSRVAASTTTNPLKP